MPEPLIRHGLTAGAAAPVALWLRNLEPLRYPAQATKLQRLGINLAAMVRRYAQFGAVGIVSVNAGLIGARLVQQVTPPQSGLAGVTMAATAGLITGVAARALSPAAWSMKVPVVLGLLTAGAGAMMGIFAEPPAEPPAS